MNRFIVRNLTLAVKHTEKLVDLVHKGKLAEELQDAIEYCANTLTSGDWMEPLGRAANTSTPRDVQKKLNTPHGPDAIIFGGTFGMLDFGDRVKAMPAMDVGRMRWACEVLDQEHKFSKLLGQIVVRGDFVTTDSFYSLRRVERDADIDVVCLSLYWHRPLDTAEHPLKEMCRDIVFSAQRVGQGLELEIERFKGLMDEEKKRHAMGKSAWRLAVDLQDMVKLAEPERHGLSDADLISKVLSTRKELQTEWRSDTCQRYLMVARKMDATCQSIMNRWELAFQRKTLVDGITLLRAAAMACTSPEEMAILLETLFFEQTCKIRKAIAPQGRGHATDATTVFRGILLRHAFFKYCRQIFPKLADSITEHGTWHWYNEKYGMTESGHLPKESLADSDDEPDTPAKGLCPEQDEPTRFASKMKLIKVCDAVASGKHDWGFTSSAKLQNHASSLDLSSEPMRTAQSKVQEIWSDYCGEFPENPKSQPANVPSAMITSVSAGVTATQTAVITSSKIMSEEEYQARLSAWMRECEQAVTE